MSEENSRTSPIGYPIRVSCLKKYGCKRRLSVVAMSKSRIAVPDSIRSCDSFKMAILLKLGKI